MIGIWGIGFQYYPLIQSNNTDPQLGRNMILGDTFLERASAATTIIIIIRNKYSNIDT